MLQAFSGRTHQIVTGITLLNIGGRTISFSNSVTMYFKKLSDQEIEEYINTDEPYDKAGAYAIQGQARKFIDHYEGEITAAMGLPTRKLKQLLKS